MKEKVGLQINMQQILNVLSSSLYKGDVLQVATRELLQNSFDATKKVANPVIDVYFDSGTRKLIFKDNGIGMTSQTVRDVFFTVGGTLKEGLAESERSGGFGIAKVQFFMAAESIDVVSVRDGVSTHVRATQEELLTGSGHIVIEATSDPAGTTVTLIFPRSYVNDRGETKSVSYYDSSVTNVIKKPLIG
jgi:HSP90 family molecular chaperone